MIKTILTYPKDKEILTQLSMPVTNSEFKSNDIQELIADLKDTLHATNNGVGISAIQIGIPKQVCICSWGGKEVVLINPSIIRSRGEKDFLEGCLSAPDKYKKITRYQKIWCWYLDENGEKQEIAEGGRMSDIIQHEMDHFQGECHLFEN